jgi:hypothetical protein
LSDYRVFEVLDEFVYHYPGGDCKPLRRGVKYVDTLYEINKLAGKGIRIDYYGDLCKFRTVRNRVPNIHSRGDLTIFTLGGIGDIIAQEPCFRRLYNPLVVMYHHRMGVIPNCDCFPVELDKVKGCVIQMMGVDPSTPDQFRSMQQIFADDLGLIDEMLPYNQWHPRIIVDEDKKQHWSDRLDELGVLRPRVMCQVAAAIKPRTYPALWMLSAMDTVAKESNCGVVLVGTDDQRPNDVMPAFINSGFCDCMGKTRTTQDYIALLSCADVIVTPATAACHIGEALNIPTVLINALYPLIYEAGHHPKLYPVESKAKCSPCERHLPEPCNKRDKAGTNICWLSITPAMIFEQVKQALSDKGESECTQS